MVKRNDVVTRRHEQTCEKSSSLYEDMEFSFWTDRVHQTHVISVFMPKVQFSY